MASPDPEQLAVLYESLLRAASDPSAWQQVLEQLTRISGSTSGCLYHAASNTVANYRMPNGFAEEYQQRLAPLDQVGRYAIMQPDFSGATSRLFAEQPELHVPAYEQRLQELGLAERWGATLPGGATLGLHRRADLPPYSDADLQLLDRLLISLRQTAALSNRQLMADRQNSFLLDCLDRLERGIILLDTQGAPLLANRLAESLAPAHRLPLPGAQPNAAGSPPAGYLKGLQAVLNGSRERAALRLRHARKPVELTIQYLSASDGPGHLAVLLVPLDRDIVLDRSMLRELHKLSEAEAEVLELLCNGHDGNAIARLRNTTVATVRGQLKSLREKTLQRTQAGLVRIGARAPRMPRRPR